MKRKTIVIESKEDYTKFIKRIVLYKSILYINTEFQVERNQINDKLQQMINGLNIKNRLIIKSDYFATREEVLKDLYAHTLTYSILRILFRSIRNLLSKTKNSNQDSINT